MTDTVLSSQESEREIVGSILLDTTKSLYICQKSNLLPDAFSNLAFRTIYTAMLDITKAPKACIDVVTVYQWLKNQGNDLKEIDIENIVKATITSAHCEHHCNVVQDLYTRRMAITTISERLNKLRTDTSISTSSHLALLSQQLLPLEKGASVTITRLEDHKNAKIKQWQDARVTGYVGIPSCFSELNSILGGWRKSLGIIGSYRGTGKSTIIRQDALWQAKNKFRVAIFSLEDPADIAAASIVGNHADTCTFYLDIGKGRDQQLDNMSSAWESLRDLPLFIVSSAYTLDQITATANLLKARYGLDIIYIDHIQYITPLQLPGMNRNNTMAIYSAHLAQLAKSLDVAIVCASQLSRDCEKGDRKPRLSDLRDSGSIEQDARQVLLLYRAENENYILEVAKNNYGVSGKDIILTRNGAMQRFERMQENETDEL